MGTIKKINVNIIETVGITFLQDPCSFSTISQCGTFTQIICRRTSESLDGTLYRLEILEESCIINCVV